MMTIKFKIVTTQKRFTERNLKEVRNQFTEFLDDLKKFRGNSMNTEIEVEEE